MGQYYQAYVKHENGTEKHFCPSTAIYMTRRGLSKVIDETPWGSIDDPDSYVSCRSGLKLTEHSWIGNNFMNGVMEEIENNPSQIAWIGDYADDDEDFKGKYKKSIYNKVWNDKIKEMPFSKVPEQHKDGFIVNHSKKEYINLEKYIEKNIVEDWGALHPLSLMTAIGNGRGGGDYWGYNNNLIGTWALDMIEYSHEVFKGYTEILPVFDPMA